ncbi:AAA family ATPase [Flavobacterium sp. CBA20B-1]|uniref:AAA family ATPase n=1 Tax=unclassified Flavobacterium TaxID=196869 RepID=UPI0022246C36|nr:MULTISPECIES: AAA family ATPase [unclassified Flavobacterium]WCM42447.1 AAA family ATPase [Flavobacterium sp. CBA20B-1]
MKSIALKKLSLTNFKGIKNQHIDFSDVTNIYGANGTGKTTIFDAFTWLLFGKDSQDRKDFDIKPLDKNGLPIQKIENEVEGVLDVNGEEIVIKRIHREKWVKKRGFSEPEFTGNETVYFWNEVPMNAKEFTSKINDLLDESVFKLISNPLAFNNLKWQDRRKVLIDIAGDINVDYASNGLSHILQLTEKKTIRELQLENASKVKKVKEELKQIPTRIDEVQKSKPVPLLFEDLEKELSLNEQRLNDIDLQLQDASNQNQEFINKKTSIQNRIFELKTQISTIENELRNKAANKTMVDTSKVDTLKQQLSNHQYELTNAQNNLQQVDNKITSSKKQLESIDFDMQKLREEWQSVNSEKLTFDESAFHCPACKREFESGDVEAKRNELTINFNTSKKNRLDAITQKGSQLKNEKEFLEQNLKGFENQKNSASEYITKLNSEVTSINAAIELEQNVLNSADTKSFNDLFTEMLLTHPDYDSLKIELNNKETELSTIQPTNNEDLQIHKTAIQNRIKEINEKLGTKIQIAAANNRIKELEQEESQLSNSLLELEKQQFDIEKFIKLNIEALEENINNKFQLVTFKLFDTQINGGEVECCEALINGVPFHSANTASRINAGIDIINTLSEFYNVSSPVFLDNRESVSYLIDTKSQIINLIVSEKDNVLRVDNVSSEFIISA